MAYKTAAPTKTEIKTISNNANIVNDLNEVKDDKKDKLQESLIKAKETNNTPTASIVVVKQVKEEKTNPTTSPQGLASCGEYDFSDFVTGTEYKMGTTQFEQAWSTTESILGRKLIRPTGNPNDGHEYQCPIIVNAVIKSKNGVTVNGNGKQVAANLYNSNPDKFEFLSTADGTLNTNSIINDGATISLYYTDAQAEILHKKYGYSKEFYLEHGHVKVNVGDSGSTLRTVEGNYDGQGSVMISEVELYELLEDQQKNNVYSRIDVANPIR